MPTLVTALLALGLSAPTGAERPPAIEQAPVFISGQEGYHTYRIPSLIRTANGTLLAFCEGRKGSSGDAGDIDLLLKRSADGGKTWGKTQVIWDDGPNTCGNPCPVLDAKSGAICLLLTHNLGADSEAAIVNGKSKGAHGLDHAEPGRRRDLERAVEITSSVKRPEWTWYATGPGIGIQLRTGRLVVPCDNMVSGDKVQQSHVILSDDGGKSWRIGGVVGPQCNECQAVELTDGRLMLNIRSYRGDHRRLTAFSEDGGETFSPPVPDQALIEPVCQASILRTGPEGRDLVFSNPASTKRERMTVKLSTDGGKAWPHALVLHEGPAAYSCLAELQDGTLACLYEQGGKSAYETITLARFTRERLTEETPAPRRRRVLYNLDGDSCMILKTGSKDPEAITAEDLKTVVRELTGPGSQVDTLLVCINAQVMYYPTKVGTQRGMDCTPEERSAWSAREEQWFRNARAMFDAGVDPYAVLLAEARKKGLEALLTFRVNDAHGNDSLRTAFWREHPEYRLGRGALDFRHAAVRDYVFRLIEEAVQRYDCDGIELDFQRFPTYFKDGTTEERVAWINALVSRVRTMLDAEGAKRGRRLVLSARVPSDYGRSAPSYETSRAIGCDPVEWARRGWIDFLTVSEFLSVRYDLPIKPWKSLISNVPIYGGVECIPTAALYRRAARHLWNDGADGIYLFNFFVTLAPPFSALREIGDPKTIEAAEVSAAGPGSWRQKQFFITFWSPPPADDKALAAVAAEHYNLTWVPEAGLDLAAKHGLRAMLTSDLLNPSTLDDPARRAKLDALIDRVRNHPALEAYFLTDEPGAGAFPGLGKLVAYLRTRDPAHLAYINLFPTYASEQQLGVTADAAVREGVKVPANLAGAGADDKVVLAYEYHLKRYLETVKPDLISYDHYHFFKNSRDTNQYFLNLGLIRQAALKARKPFLNIIQASLVEKVWRLPNAQELRFLAFTTMAYGGRGISYFLYWGSKDQGGLYQDGKASPLSRDAAALNAEIARFGPALMELESRGVYHTAPLPYGTSSVPADSPVRIQGAGEFVLGLFGDGGKTTAFMVVNRDYRKAASATLKVNTPGRRIQEFDRKTGQWTKPAPLGDDLQIKLTLDAGDGRLFRVVP